MNFFEYDEEVLERRGPKPLKLEPEILRRRLKASGITIKEAARHLGLKRSALGHKLRGRRRFSSEELFVIASLLDTTVEELLVPSSLPYSARRWGKGGGKRPETLGGAGGPKIGRNSSGAAKDAAMEVKHD